MMGIVGQPEVDPREAKPGRAAGLGGLNELRASNLLDLVFEELRSAIMDKSLAPGLRVTEAALAKQLNVSKTPVREALLRLREIGLIEDDGRRGVRVIAPSRQALEQAYEVREALEAAAARYCAERASESERSSIAVAAGRSLSGANAGDAEEFQLWDKVFHRNVAESTSNPRLSALLDDVSSLVAALRTRDLPKGRPSVECAQSHVAIATAIQERKPDEASALMKRHIEQVKGYVLGSLEEAHPKDSSS